MQRGECEAGQPTCVCGWPAPLWGVSPPAPQLSLSTHSTHWDLEKGVKLQDYPGHNGDVVSMSLSPDNNTYVTGSVDQSCKLWDVRSPDCKQIFYGHSADVNSVCVSILVCVTANSVQPRPRR